MVWRRKDRQEIERVRDERARDVFLRKRLGGEGSLFSSSSPLKTGERGSKTLMRGSPRI